MSKKYRKEYRENITTFKGMDGKLASLTSRYITAKKDMRNVNNKISVCSYALKAANSNAIVLGFTQPVIESTIHCNK